MKFRYITIIIAGALTLSVLNSCIDDDSKYGDIPVPRLKVEVPDTEVGSMPEVNFNLGEECVIKPQISYDGSGSLHYEWSVGSYANGVKGELQFVSNELELHHSFPAGGTYYAHLNVTDGVVGFSQDYQVNVNRTFEQGYLIVSNSKSGIGNLAFIKDLTPEEKEQGMSPITMEHCLEAVNEGTNPEYLAGVSVLQVSWPTDATRIVASYGSTSYYLDPNTFISLSTINHNDVIPGFKARTSIGGADAVVYDPVMNRFITLFAYDMIGVEESKYASGQFGFDYYNFYAYSEYGTLVYNNFFVCHSPLEVFFIDYYGNRIDQTSIVDENTNQPIGNVFDGHSCVNVFGGLAITYTYEYWGQIYESSYFPCCVISKDEATGKYWYTRLSGFGTYDMSMGLASRSEIDVTSTTAIPDVEGAITLSHTYQRGYYTCNNKVYVMTYNNEKAILPNESQSVLSFPANEEITYMTINADTEELIVATADKTTGRGSVYFYDTANVRTDSPNTPAKAYYPDCADRISFMIYKPRVADNK
ncbi:MAG: hypothetical protein OSJ41_01010 [Duncaniella sp.]|nr:hypothetical protein [Duncaniella sp.]